MVMPNDQKMSHAGESRQPEIRSDNCQT